MVLLRLAGIRKSFPGVQALRGVDLELWAGEVLAIVGENGAGKSTLIRVLGGAHLPDAGGIAVAGQDVCIRTPQESRRLGVAIIYQEFNLVPTLTVCDNIFLGQERTRAGFLRRADERLAAARLLERLGVRVDPEALCRDLTVAQQQVVEIAKALSLQARILVMDEPTATLTPPEVERLHSIIRELRSQGLGIIYISHRLQEVLDLADRVLVLRDGEQVATRPLAEVTRQSLIEMMVGRRLDAEFPTRGVTPGRERLVVTDLAKGEKVRRVSFSVRAGEVLALTGLVGAGRTETVRLLFGAELPESGTIELDGRRLRLKSPRDAVRSGIGLLTEDRKAQGLVLGLSVRENFGLPNLGQFARFGVLRQEQERSALSRYVSSLGIRLAGHDVAAGTLSGGNQQKVVLAKWLQRHCEVVIFDEPTRGIDVGAKYEIYQLINELVAQGKAVIMVSSELPEVLGLADRILVMHAGRITGEIRDVANATQEQVMALATG
jgi:ABC-type sugar transport system ATPase subunit